MSLNEGKLDTVQSYDSQILSAGAMQKTIDSFGTGEFPQQVWEFKQQQPALYTQLFEQCGWTVTIPNNSSAKMYFNGKFDETFEDTIRAKFTNDTVGNNKPLQTSNILAPIVCAISNIEFQKKQVQDFITRLNVEVLPTKPLGFNYTIGNYTRSELGGATVLDQSVNRRDLVARDFGIALHNFYTHHKEASENPNKWTKTQRNLYEKQILDYYGRNREMNNAKERYSDLKTRLPILNSTSFPK